MTIRRVLTVPDERLTQACADVDFADPRTLELGEDLLETMVFAAGRGLAAPQVGVCVRMFAMRLGDRLAVLCNPTIIRHGKDVVTDVEGCLSIPGRRLAVPRYNIVEVGCYNISGVHQPPLKLRGIDARCAQHEIDHLSGKLITEY